MNGGFFLLTSKIVVKNFASLRNISVDCTDNIPSNPKNDSELQKKLNSVPPRLITLIGPSGSGKSSIFLALRCFCEGLCFFEANLRNKGERPQPFIRVEPCENEKINIFFTKDKLDSVFELINNLSGYAGYPYNTIIKVNFSPNFNANDHFGKKMKNFCATFLFERPRNANGSFKILLELDGISLSDIDSSLQEFAKSIIQKIIESFAFLSQDYDLRMKFFPKSSKKYLASIYDDYRELKYEIFIKKMKDSGCDFSRFCDIFFALTSLKPLKYNPDTRCVATGYEIGDLVFSANNYETSTLTLKNISGGQLDAFFSSMLLSKKKGNIFLDEPGQNLGVSARIALRDIILKESRCENKKIFLVTHHSEMLNPYSIPYGLIYVNAGEEVHSRGSLRAASGNPKGSASPHDSPGSSSKFNRACSTESKSKEESKALPDENSEEKKESDEDSSENTSDGSEKEFRPFDSFMGKSNIASENAFDQIKMMSLMPALFSSRVILVEGYSDAFFYQNTFSSFGFFKPGTVILDCKGWGGVLNIHEICGKFSIEAYAIYDSDVILQGADNKIPFYSGLYSTLMANSRINTKFVEKLIRSNDLGNHCATYLRNFSSNNNGQNFLSENDIFDNQKQGKSNTPGQSINDGDKQHRKLKFQKITFNRNECDNEKVKALNLLRLVLAKICKSFIFSPVVADFEGLVFDKNPDSNENSLTQPPEMKIMNDLWKVLKNDVSVDRYRMASPLLNASVKLLKEKAISEVEHIDFGGKLRNFFYCSVSGIKFNDDQFLRNSDEMKEKSSITLGIYELLWFFSEHEIFKRHLDS